MENKKLDPIIAVIVVLAGFGFLGWLGWVYWQMKEDQEEVAVICWESTWSTQYQKPLRESQHIIQEYCSPESIIVYTREEAKGKTMQTREQYNKNVADEIKNKQKYCRLHLVTLGYEDFNFCQELLNKKGEELTK